jgi:G3E family GTPase
MHATTAPEPTPVNLLTGFLGAGKTTLLKRLLAQPALADAAVLINEFGDIGLDHQLLERIDGDTVLLPSGCVCCTVRGDLSDALRALHARRERGEVPWFRRAVLESSGLADPFPIASTLHADPVLRHHFRLGRIVTVVDAVHGQMQLDRHEQSLRQAAVADQIVVSKSSLAGPAATAALVARLARINPLAPCHDAERDVVDAALLLCGEAVELPARSAQARQWWDAARPALRLPGANGADETEGLAAAATPPAIAARDGTAAARYLGAMRPAAGQAAGHGADLRAFAITLTEPLDWTRFALWLSMLVHRHGTALLRIKCILDVQGSDTPVALHGVQHLIHAPQHLAAWPGAARQSQLVFIAEGLQAAVVERSLRAFLGSR